MCTGISGRGADQGLVLDSVRAIAYARRAVEIGDRSDSLVVSDAYNSGVYEQPSRNRLICGGRRSARKRCRPANRGALNLDDQ